MKSVEMRQERAKLIQDAGAILAKSADELTQFEKMHADADALAKRIERVELQETRDKELAESALETRDVTGPRDDGPSADPKENLEAERRAFESFMRFGREGMTPEELETNKRYLVTSSEARQMARGLPEKRQQTVTTTGGGHLIPRAFQTELDVALLAFGGMRGAARIVPTSDGATLDWPTVNDTTVKGRLLAINIAVTTTDLVYGTVPFEAYKYSSDAVLVPVELAQDSAFDIDAHVREMLTTRLGRITNEHFTTGTGTAQPNGAVTAAVDSTVNVSIAAGLTYQNVLDLEHSVDPAYRLNPKVAFMCHDDGVKLFRQVLDANNRPIFQSQDETPGRLATAMGYPIITNQDVAKPDTATNKSFLFGDFNKYIIRMVRPMVLLRLVERFADNHQIGFFAFERADGDLVDAGTNPLKFADMIA